MLNQNQDIIKGKLRLTVISAITGEIIQDTSNNLTISKVSIVEISSFIRKDLPPDENWIITAVLYDESNKTICRNYYLTKLWKHVQLKQSTLELKMLKKGGSTQLEMKSDNPVFFIDLYHKDVTFSDRGFFILPGEQIKLNVFGDELKTLKVEDIKIFSLNNYLCE